VDIQIRPIYAYRFIKIGKHKVHFADEDQAKRAILHCLNKNVEFEPGVEVLDPVQRKAANFADAKEFIAYMGAYHEC